MSVWSKLIDKWNTGGADAGRDGMPPKADVARYAMIDIEMGATDHKIRDIGAIRYDGAVFHKASKAELPLFLQGVHYLCGHNIVHHDAHYLFGDDAAAYVLVDTLYMSPILFPERPYHHLVKDDKLLTDQLNNPVNDCEKARALLMDEMQRWRGLPLDRRRVLATLLAGEVEFSGFMSMVEAHDLCLLLPHRPTALWPRRSSSLDIDVPATARLIRTEYEGMICQNADVEALISSQPCALAYALSLIGTADHHSVTPGWVLHHYPEVEHIIRLLRQTRCEEGCDYCNRWLNPHRGLKLFFGYDSFRTYDGEPLQENAVRAAVQGQSLLAVFPTGGGKSLTFQLPAMMSGRLVHGLTVVISPLQSLMKDQVDNLASRGITDAVTINGLLDPIARAQAIESVQNGDASMLYIAPEMLRSKTIERLLTERHVVRFVIDEAHCFSARGQDFRVDYLYIGKFISEYQRRKGGGCAIPVSCFTATAKQKVVQDICDYFRKWLGADLQIYASEASRTNLRYSVIHVDTDEDKYTRLRALVAEASCPTIVYVSRTKRTAGLAQKLTRDGLAALPFNGKMSPDDKKRNQEAFMTGRTDIIVATSAFGMGIDKSDVGLVVHYDISDSLENYVQEAGRAGRDPHLTARCYVLYADSDLDKHFILLNQTKLSIGEIQQVWSAVKKMTRQRTHVCCSALEIARQAGWDDTVPDMEARVRTALSALEQGGYVERGNNAPHVYATGITVKNMEEARRRIMSSVLFGPDEVENVVRIIKSLISQKYTSRPQDVEGESRVDYLADTLGLTKRDVVSAVERMRQEGILADSKDLTADIEGAGTTGRRSRNVLDRYAALERYILTHIPANALRVTYKQFNDNAVREGISTSSEKSIRTLVYFLVVKGYVRRADEGGQVLSVRLQEDVELALRRYEQRILICRFIIEWLCAQVREASAGANQANAGDKQAVSIQFSLVELHQEMARQQRTLFQRASDITLEEVEEALLYLTKIDALKLEGGFMVLYSAMTINRLKDRKLRYKQDDYRLLNEFYKQKIQQIHIVGEYANLMVRDYSAALQFVHDYFHQDYRAFIEKYFKGDRVREIERNITPRKYAQLFGQLSSRQQEIITDKQSRCIVVAAGPGSGKTRTLVHKLASLLLLEDVKHEQLLMLTFSRSAATEFKQRLIQLIGNAANFVEIRTFHAYCFDLIGRVGNMEDVSGVVPRATQMVRNGEVEPSRIGKTVLVIDEAQDMGEDEYALVSALMDANEEMRVVAVGDDDQNIFAFAGVSARYMAMLGRRADAHCYELTENYRSLRHVVDAANSFVVGIHQRLKTSAIRSMSDENGRVEVTHHSTRCMYQPVLDKIKGTHGGGSACVLTRTNEEAVVMLGLLRGEGLKASLIQSMEGLRFCNLAEMRYFMKAVATDAQSPVISDEIWEKAKQRTFHRYAGSQCLPYAQTCLQRFEQTSQSKYLTDFKEYVFESEVEDFFLPGTADIVVSTIHKAKGREYDDVYMLVSDSRNLPSSDIDNTLRCYYVGITRARRRLFIHTNSSLFNGLKADTHTSDTCLYPEPGQIVLHLTHRDVKLGFFKDQKNDVLALRSGDTLTYDADKHVIYDKKSGRSVAKPSAKMEATLEQWHNRGYRVTGASVRFVVAWKPKGAPGNEPETAVLLPSLTLVRSNGKG